jgi:YYY domain-containing protein
MTIAGSPLAGEIGLIIRWWLLFIALMILGLPVAARLFKPFPGRGSGFGLPLSLMIITFVTYWIGRFEFSAIAYGSGLLVLTILAVYSWHAGAIVKWRPAVSSFGVFTVGFTVAIGLKLIHPEIDTGAEHFLDFGLLQSTLRADVLPPEDMWFAGRHVQYYYGSHLAIAILTELTSTSPAYSYNLAFAGVVGMFLMAVYELTGTIAEVREESRRLAGITGVFLVGVASNLMTPIQLALGALLWLIPDSILLTIWPRFREVAIKYPSGFDWFSPSRIIPGTINEFPLFAFINGNPHPHVVSPPLLAVSAAVAYSYYLTDESAVYRRQLLIFGVVPFITGLILVVDSWSFPTVLGLTWLALVFSPGRLRTLLPDRPIASIEQYLSTDSCLRADIERTVGASLIVLILGIGSMIVVFPFVSGIASGRTVAVMGADQRSGVVGLLIVHGVFLIPLAAHVIPRIRIKSWIKLATLSGLGILSVMFHFHALFLFVPLIIGGWLWLRTSHDDGFEVVLIIGGAGILFLTEVVYLNPLFVASGYVPRFNTVFKAYFQVWVIWSAATGSAIQRVIRNSSLSLNSPLVGQFGTTEIKMALISILILSSSSYAGLWLINNGSNMGSTINGLAYAEREHPDEMEAIEWLDTNVSGQPTIVTAPGVTSDRWGAGAAATMTGIPTVAGWSKEMTHRGRAAYMSRVRDVRIIYEGTTVEKTKLLKTYDVTYIYVGPTERSRYDIQGFSEEDGITSAFRNDEVIIYRINVTALSS